MKKRLNKARITEESTADLVALVRRIREAASSPPSADPAEEEAAVPKARGKL